MTRARQYYDADHGLSRFLAFSLSDDDDDDDGNDDDGILPRQDSTANKARRADANQERSEERGVNAAKNNT